MTRWLTGVVAVLVVSQAVTLWLLVRDPAETTGVRVALRSAGLPLERRTPLGRLLVQDEAGVLIADGDLAAVVQVPPGRYQLRIVPTAVIGATPATIEDVELIPREVTSLVIELPVGELTLDARARGQVVAQIFAGSQSERPVTTITAGNPVLIAAGEYDLRVAHIVATEEVAVRWIRGVTVEPGRHTAPRIEFTETKITVRAFASGRMLAPQEGTVTVFRAGDAMREIVATGAVAEALAMEPGRYDVAVTLTAAADRPVKMFADVDLTDAQMQELDAHFETAVLFAKGDLGGPETLGDYDAYLYVYHPRQHETPIAYIPMGHAILLSAGRYDLRAFLLRSEDQPSQWVRDVYLAAGETRVETTRFDAGRLLVHVLNAGGKELVGDAAQVRAFEGASNTHPLAHWRAGEVVTIGAGRYVLKVTESLEGTIGSFDVTVSAGQLTEQTVTLTPTAASVATDRRIESFATYP